MAEAKKTVAKEGVSVVETPKTVEEPKAAKVEKEAAPKAAKAETVKKTAAKKTDDSKEKTAKEPAAKKTAAKKTPAKSRAKKATEVAINVQFAGKSYTTEELIQIAKDVWVYDLQKAEKDFASVELYVKPEESTVYYVINGDTTGNFAI